MIDRQRFDEFVDQARTFKEHVWRTHGVRDFPPSCACIWRDADPVIIDLGVVFDSLGDVPLPEAVRIAIETTTGEVTIFDEKIKAPETLRCVDPTSDKLEQVWVVTEAYGVKLDQGDEVPDHGELAADFKNNPASDVFERLIVACWVDDMVGGVESLTISIPFTISDGGVINWGELELAENADKGRLDSMVRSLFGRFSHA